MPAGSPPRCGGIASALSCVAKHSIWKTVPPVDRSLPQTDPHCYRSGRGTHMASTAFAPSQIPVSIPAREILPWAVFGGLLCLLALYFVGAEQGATSLSPGTYTHEFVHDGRHLLGFPCH